MNKQREDVSTRPRGGQIGNVNRIFHGLTVLKRAVNGLGNRVIDKRTVTGKALTKWREDLIMDLGGNVSTQQSAMIDLCVKSKLLLDSIDVWLLSQPTLINKRKKALLPVVRERQALADGLARYLTTLGLDRITPPPKHPWEIDEETEQTDSNQADDAEDNGPDHQQEAE